MAVLYKLCHAIHYLDMHLTLPFDADNCHTQQQKIPMTWLHHITLSTSPSLFLLTEYIHWWPIASCLLKDANLKVLSLRCFYLMITNAWQFSKLFSGSTSNSFTDDYGLTWPDAYFSYTFCILYHPYHLYLKILQQHYLWVPIYLFFLIIFTLADFQLAISSSKNIMGYITSCCRFSSFRYF